MPSTVRILRWVILIVVIGWRGSRSYGKDGGMTLKVGLQLFSVRNALAKDPWGTLESVARAGFTFLEAANHNAAEDPGVGFGVDAGPLRRTLDDLGLAVVGCHVNPLRLDILPRALDYQAELGNNQVGCDIEFYPAGDHDYVLRRADTFNQVGALAKERGMRFYYHNHFQEFQRIDGRPVYEILLENTDPDLVDLQIDVYWMYRGGQDAVEWMKRCADRVILLHQKDFPKDASQPLNLYEGVVDPSADIDLDLFLDRVDPACFTEVGTGTLPIKDILDTAATLPRLEYVFLEQDHTTLDEIDSIRTSREAFSRLADVAWS
jgi:sugar phosphate isomerase/epimerase